MFSSFIDRHDSLSVGLRVGLVTSISMIIATIVATVVMNQGQHLFGMTLASMIVGVIVAIPTALTVVIQVNREKPAALAGAVALVTSYLIIFLTLSCLAQRFILNINDIFYMGIPALGVYAFVKWLEAEEL